MTLGVGIALAAVIVALLSFISTQLSLRRTADSTYVGGLEGRLKDAEGRLTACEVSRAGMIAEMSNIRDENLWLTRKLIELQREGKVTIDPDAPLVRRAEQAARSEGG